MKKLRLKACELEGAEILSREQLKKVLGGDGSGTGTGGSGTGFDDTTTAGSYPINCGSCIVYDYDDNPHAADCLITYPGNPCMCDKQPC